MGNVNSLKMLTNIHWPIIRNEPCRPTAEELATHQNRGEHLMSKAEAKAFVPAPGHQRSRLFCLSRIGRLISVGIKGPSMRNASTLFVSLGDLFHCRADRHVE